MSNPCMHDAWGLHSSEEEKDDAHGRRVVAGAMRAVRRQRRHVVRARVYPSIYSLNYSDPWRAAGGGGSRATARGYHFAPPP
jgi:hypothetical protein